MLMAAGAGQTPTTPAPTRDPMLAALLNNPQIQAMLTGTNGPAQPAAPAALAAPPAPPAPATPASAPAGGPPAVPGIPGFAELAASFPGGPEKLQEILNDPQVLGFISANPEIVSQVLGDGPPDPEKLEALLALAGPPPPGAEQGIFGPDIFAGK